MALMTTYRYGGLSQESIMDHIKGMSCVMKVNTVGMEYLMAVAVDRTMVEIKRILRERFDVEEPMF